MLLTRKLTIQKTQLTLPVLSFLLLGALLLSLAIGPVKIAPFEVLSIIAEQLGFSTTEVTSTKRTVLIDIRMPRLIQTLLIGGALGISGAALQGLFRNPLVEPGLIGVSSGAALAAVLIITFGSMLSPVLYEALGVYLLPVFAFIGGLSATLIVYHISKSYGKTSIAILLLAGVAIIALTQAFVGLSIFFADDNQLRTFQFWTLGDLGRATWNKLTITAPFIIFPLIMLFGFSKHLNAIALGEAEAFHMGVNVEKVKYRIIILTALIVGTSVSLAGIIGFIGLVIPHIVRLFIGSNHKIVLPGSFLGGALLLVIADIISRTIVTPSELPIGIVTAIIGTPFFLWILISTKKKRLIG